ncbi:MAG: hypothetical protein IKI91_08410 [Clostridia bacterium]|nr:hypothetical protein [Clostridia bacterium]
MIKLDPLFRDHAVFAENEPICVFGSGAGNVRVTFCGETETASAGGGRWFVFFPPMSAGGPYEMTVEADGATTVVRDIYVGLVYFVMGQSNAEFRLSESNTPKEYYVSDPLLRDFYVDRPWDKAPILRTADGWITAKEEQVGDWTALGYLSGRLVRERTGKAVGVISCYQFASVIESWLPKEVSELYKLPDDQLYEDHFLEDCAPFNGVPGAIYDNMLSKILPYRASGVIWYQGESDSTVEEAARYDKGLGTLINIIRDGQANRDLPFVVVELADCDYRKEVLPDGWEALREAQARVARDVPNVKLVVSRDVCEALMHPITRTKLAERIADALTEEDLNG